MKVKIKTPKVKTTHALYQGDVLNVAKIVELKAWTSRFVAAIADPPDNIGLKYETYRDRLSHEDYRLWMRNVLNTLVGCSNTTWFSFNAKWTTMVGGLLHGYPHCPIEVRPIIQYYTFGSCQKRDLTNAHRPLWRIRRFAACTGAPIYPVKVPSWRQQNGDKRAAPGGKMPDDVWPIPRVTGNSQQRRSWHPTQLHEELVERCILMSTKEGDTVLDAFSGTGTVIRVAKRLGRNTVSVELDAGYCKKIADEHGLTVTTLG